MCGRMKLDVCFDNHGRVMGQRVAFCLLGTKDNKNAAIVLVMRLVSPASEAVR